MWTIEKKTLKRSRELFEWKDTLFLFILKSIHSIYFLSPSNMYLFDYYSAYNLEIDGE